MFRFRWLVSTPLAGVIMLLGLSACGQAMAGDDAVRVPEPRIDPPAAQHGEQVAVFAGGCFWGVEAVFDHVKGVRRASAGYAGGQAATATYAQVSDGDTGHAESVKLIYDPAQVSYAQLLKVFFSVVQNPTELNRQGPDHGSQYRSVIFYANAYQKQVASAYIGQLTAAKVFPATIVTQLAPLGAFYTAEPYHQNYASLHPDDRYIVYNDAPKVVHLKQLWPALYKPQESVVQVQLH